MLTLAISRCTTRVLAVFTRTGSDYDRLAATPAFTDGVVGLYHLVNRNDWTDLATVADYAAQVSALCGEEYIAVDNGGWCSPRYDIVRLPRVGDKVSQTYNGDYYPCGEIVKIGKNHARVTTSDGTVFTRRLHGAGALANSARWCVTGSGFTLVRGHRDERNPSF